jgi:hypothetical protein
MAWHVFSIRGNGLYRQRHGRVYVQLKAPLSSDLLDNWDRRSTIRCERELDDSVEHIVLESCSDHSMATLRVDSGNAVVMLFLSNKGDRLAASLQLGGNKIADEESL